VTLFSDAVAPQRLAATFLPTVSGARLLLCNAAENLPSILSQMGSPGCLQD